MASKTYLITTPDGETTRVTNMSAYCRRYGLSKAGMSKVANGATSHHQGYFVKIISSDESSKLEALERRKNNRIIEACNKLLKTPYTKLTVEQKNELVLTLYAIEKVFGEMS